MCENQTTTLGGKDQGVGKKTHPTHIPGFRGTNRELGQAIAAMRYDQVVEVLEGMSDEVLRQADADHKLKRYQLGGHLTMLPTKIEKVIDAFQKIFTICRPFMDHEFTRMPARIGKAKKNASR